MKIIFIHLDTCNSKRPCPTFCQNHFQGLFMKEYRQILYYFVDGDYIR